ncbi:unnamed protein product [Knipowitschia caucasica]
MWTAAAGLLLLLSLIKESVSIQVIVPETKRTTALFASITLRCDYSTSASNQEILVTWKYKSFCKDPVIEFYSTAYQSAQQLGQDPANDCPDSQRTLRTVAQKRGSNEPNLGTEYSQRKITIINKADLQITEVMWWDNGMYFCQVDAPGDTVGDNDKEIQLIVYHWLTVLGIVIGALLLLLLFFICCCQCCPQACCCYVRCPCCPQQCCCPEKMVMQHRMMKEAQRAMAPWMGGQPVYAPMSQMSSQMNPALYPGSVSGKSIPLKPIPLPHPHSSAYSMPPPSAHSNNTNHMLDYLESQVRGMDVNTPLMQAPSAPPPHMQQMPPPQQMPNRIPFSPGPPSMLSALDDVPNERRVITLPPIREPGRVPPPGPKTRPPSSSESSRSGFGRRDDRGAGGRRHPSPTRSRGIPRSYSEESLDGRGRSGPRGGMDRPQSRSRDDLFDNRSRSNYSPPAARRSRGSWSSEEDSRRGGRRTGAYGDHPPSYTEYEPGQKPGARRNERYNDNRSRTGTSVVI